MDKTKILLVDDEPDINELMQQFLIRKNYSVMTAVNGKEAEVLAKSQCPDIVLLDIRLGGDSGLDVLKKIKEIDKKIKVIMVSALDDNEIISQARSLGADDYITKPFTSAYLNDFILQKISKLSLNQQMQDEK